MSSNGESIRQDVSQIINDLLEQKDLPEYKNMSASIEKGIYNNTIRYCDSKGILKSINFHQ